MVASFPLCGSKVGLREDDSIEAFFGVGHASLQGSGLNQLQELTQG